MGLRRQDVVAFCIWVAILVASPCAASAEKAPSETFSIASLDSFFASSNAPGRSDSKEDPTTLVPAIPPLATPQEGAGGDTIALAGGEPAPAAPVDPDAEKLARNLVRYEEAQLESGAVTLPLAAEIRYRRALEAIGRGERESAEKHLRAALSLAPGFSDAHFTLARLNAQRFHSDAVYYFVEGVAAQLKRFDGQRLFAINAVVGTTLILLVASFIVWIALAVRYLPFIAHRISESARTKFNATGARFAATLLLLALFALLPSYTSAAALILILTCPFMQRRERALSFVMAGVFVAFASLAPVIDRFSVVAVPLKLTSLIATAHESPADEALARAIASAPVSDPEIEDDRYTALGLLAMRGGESKEAAANFLRAISVNKNSAIAYVNLGNVFYLNGRYNKALEGYRKAEEVDSTDAVGQYNLAQAYIKTLLMGESSRALSRASKMGLDQARESIAEPARSRMAVYQKTFSSAQLWRIAVVEGKYHNPGLVANMLETVTGHTTTVNAIIMGAAMALAFVMSRILKSRKLAFSCANCGELTCEGCCNDELGSVICQACGEAVNGVSSDRVLDALLRQRRQLVIVRRRKSIRWSTVWLPGMRHVFYGRFVGGFAVATLFAASALALWTRGYVFPFWDALEYPATLKTWVVPAVGVFLSYAIALLSRQLYEARNTRTVSTRGHGSEHSDSSQSA